MTKEYKDLVRCNHCNNLTDDTVITCDSCEDVSCWSCYERNCADYGDLVEGHSEYCSNCI